MYKHRDSVVFPQYRKVNSFYLQSGSLIAKNAFRKIRDSVRRVLEYFSECESDFLDHMITERKFPIHPSDFNLIHINGKTEFTNGHLQRLMPLHENNIGTINMALSRRCVT